jgi:hypothetical protein
VPKLTSLGFEFEAPSFSSTGGALRYGCPARTISSNWNLENARSTSACVPIRLNPHCSVYAQMGRSSLSEASDSIPIAIPTTRFFKLNATDWQAVAQF